MAFAEVGRTAVGASRSLARYTRRRLRAFVVVVAPRSIVAEAVYQAYV